MSRMARISVEVIQRSFSFSSLTQLCLIANGSISERSEDYFNEAERLDPRNVYLLAQHAFSYSYLRHFPEALRKFDQVLNITPDDVDTITGKAAIAQAEAICRGQPRFSLRSTQAPTTPAHWKRKSIKRSLNAIPDRSFLG